MLSTIKTHVLDLLEADARLCAGGAAYQDGWTGVKRVAAASDQVSGYVKLYSHVYTPGGGMESRPGIFLGSKGMQADDKLDFVTFAGRRLEYRSLLLPLILAVQAARLADAEAQRDQLFANVRAICFDHYAESGFWYEMTMPGQSGGGMAKEHLWSSATSDNAEAMASLPLVIRYSWSASSPP